LGAAVLSGAAVSAALASSPQRATAPVGEGPFYPINGQTERDYDMTRVEGAAGRAKGDIILVQGRVLDDTGKPVSGALVDVWQANAAGRYDHEKDPSTAPIDPNFQSWAQVRADSEGAYSFLTIKPGAYPAEEKWVRPPHIHFKVSKRGYHEITTQMFFEGEPLNDIDNLYLAVAIADRAGITAKATRGTAKDGEAALLFGFDVVLKKA